MAETKRSGDKVFIEGDYQERALHKGIVFQRAWHRLKLQAATRSLATCPQPSILDIGCGSGTLLQFVPPAYKSYMGVDANSAAIEYCRLKYAAPVNQFVFMQFDDLPQLSPQRFSHIFFLESIEHISREQGQRVLKNALELLEKNGQMIITTPNRKSAWPLIEKALDFFRLTPALAGEQHEHLYSIKELTMLAEAAGFSVKRCITMNGMAPWLSFMGKSITEAIHNWECNRNWLPGSLIVMELEPKRNL